MVLMRLVTAFAGKNLTRHSVTLSEGGGAGRTGMMATWDNANAWKI